VCVRVFVRACVYVCVCVRRQLLHAERPVPARGARSCVCVCVCALVSAHFRELRACERVDHRACLCKRDVSAYT